MFPVAGSSGALYGNMAALDVRNNSAVMKRAEQLKRWEESDTNREPPVPRPEKGRRIKFSSGCVFLAACLAGDKEEVIKLLDSGADINTANVDGLTALHQACIDDNLEMVEFLVEHGADINRQDNEGWTPLHATASCGFVSIAHYLVEHGADVAAVNSDGDLAVDLAVDIQHLGMIDFMQKMVAEHNIDCEKARQAEEQQMLNDAKRWLRSDASEVDRPHPKTGATALHVAAAKGYTKVLSLLLAGRGNVDKQDNDGWTPLHAAAHWSQKEAAEMLVDAMADMDVRNYAGQTCIDVAERKMVKFLEELRANNKRIKRRPSSQINSRISDTIEHNHIDNAANKIIRVEVRPDQSKEKLNDEKQAMEALTAQQQLQQQQQKNNTEITISEDEAPWRRNSLATRNRSPPESPVKNQVPDVKNTTTSTEATDVILRRTQSFENDEKFYQKYNELRARIKANSCPILPASLTNNTPSVLGPVNTTIQNYNSVQRSASLKDHRNFRKPATASTTTTSATSTTATPTTTNIVTMPTTIITTPVRRSFVPPVRDEESETQRKAHAKRVRETRRSTQGVTLDEIKSAEELVKKKNSSMANNNNTTDNNSNSNDAQTSTTSATTSQELGTQETTTPSALIANVGGEAIDSTAAATPTPSANDVVQKREDESVRDDDDDITATFTIIAPTVKYRLPTSTEHERLDEMSATFTMTSRHESPAASPSSDTYTPIETTIVVTPPEITIDAPQEEKTEEDVDAEVKPNELCTSNDSLSSVECQTAKNHENNETANVEKLTQTAAATVISFESKAEEHPEVNSETASELEATRGGNTVGTPPPQPVMGPPSLDSPVRMREKRSIFDLDNVNSLSLGEKLRNEANKHSDDRSFTAISDQAASDSDRDSVFSNYSRRSLDSSPLHMGCGGASTTERRPSWRLKFDAGCKFKLEDASTGTTYPPTNSTIIPSAPAVIAAANLSSYAAQRRLNSSSNAINSSTQSLNSIGRPVSAPTTVNAATSVTHVGDTPNNDRTGDFSTSFPTRRCSVMTSTTAIPTSTPSNTTTSALQTAAHPTSLLSKSGEDKENDKENDNRSSAATQAVLQRRRKPKRRSTGVVHLDMDDLDPERQDTNAETDEKESGNERTPRSRLTSSTNASATDDSKARVRSENGGDLIDYKALWEAVKLENEKLKQQLKKKDDEVIQSKATLERFTNAQLEVFKTENQRLKEENGALIRVISKLSK